MGVWCRGLCDNYSDTIHQDISTSSLPATLKLYSSEHEQEEDELNDHVNLCMDIAITAETLYPFTIYAIDPQLVA